MTGYHLFTPGLKMVVKISFFVQTLKYKKRGKINIMYDIWSG
jgi:hypothetical protein